MGQASPREFVTPGEPSQLKCISLPRGVSLITNVPTSPSHFFRFHLLGSWPPLFLRSYNEAQGTIHQGQDCDQGNWEGRELTSLGLKKHPLLFHQDRQCPGQPICREGQRREHEMGVPEVWTTTETTVDLDQERKDLLNPGKKKKKTVQKTDGKTGKDRSEPIFTRVWWEQIKNYQKSIIPFIPSVNTSAFSLSGFQRARSGFQAGTTYASTQQNDEGEPLFFYVCLKYDQG